MTTTYSTVSAARHAMRHKGPKSKRWRSESLAGKKQPRQFFSVYLQQDDGDAHGSYNDHAHHRLVSRLQVPHEETSSVMRVFYSGIAATEEHDSVVALSTNGRDRTTYGVNWHGRWLVMVYDKSINAVVTCLQLHFTCNEQPCIQSAPPIPTYAQLISMSTGIDIALVYNATPDAIPHPCSNCGTVIHAACNISGVPCDCGGTHQIYEVAAPAI